MKAKIFSTIVLAATLAACKHGGNLKESDSRSGPDAKRSGAREIRPNVAITDEVSFANQDRTDWYVVQLRGKAGVLATVINWDNETSDIMIDVFNEFGKQISASPVRNKLSKEKTLLTQIDKPGVYYIRVTAPNHNDGTVYTMEAKWDAPAQLPQVPPPVETEHHRSQPREPREPKERDPIEGNSVQGRIVSAYRDGSGGLTLHIDKGNSSGIRAGMSGTVLLGPSGEDPLPGGDFKIIQVLDANKCVAKTSVPSVGKNIRVMINLGK